MGIAVLMIRLAYWAALALLAALAMFLTAPARANPCGNISLESFVALAKGRPQYVAHHVLTGEQLALGAALFNSLPPPSDDKWTLVVVVDYADGSGQLVVGRDGSVCHAPLIPEKYYQALKRGLFGTPI